MIIGSSLVDRARTASRNSASVGIGATGTDLQIVRSRSLICHMLDTINGCDGILGKAVSGVALSELSKFFDGVVPGQRQAFPGLKSRTGAAICDRVFVHNCFPFNVILLRMTTDKQLGTAVNWKEPIMCILAIDIILTVFLFPLALG
jgi:hypothetical protein